MKNKIQSTLIYCLTAIFFYACVSSGLSVSVLKTGTYNYAVKESYKVVAGELTGNNGFYDYNMTVGIKTDSLVFDNFARSYKLSATLKDDSIFIAPQSFPYNNSRVTISGKGIIKKDSLFVEYISGGPMGQMECRIKAVRNLIN